MTIPASSTILPPDLRRPVSRRKSNASSPSQSTSQESSNSSNFITSNPAGNIEKVTPQYREKSKYDKGWRRIVRNFGPSWFSVTMGTGVVSLLFGSIPFQTDWLYWLAVAFFVLNIVIFTTAAITSFLRYTLYPEIWIVMIRDPTNSLFLGTSCMGFATLIDALVHLCCPHWGPWATYLAWGLWIFVSILSLAVTLSLSFLLISQTRVESLERITAAQLLPIATTIVAAGAGANTASALLAGNHDPYLALGTVLVSYVLWGMSTPFALIILVIYYQRLAVHHLPPREIIVSSFLPLGPLGMGGYAIALLGRVFRDVLPRTTFLAHVPVAGDIVYILGLLGALSLWAFGLTWFVFAIAAISSCGSFPFNMGWWGFTFPLGVFALSTIQLGVEFPSLFFRVLGTIFAVMVILLWIVVFLGTVKGAWEGHLFYAPCLKNLPQESKHGICVKDASKMIGPEPDPTDLEKGT